MVIRIDRRAAVYGDCGGWGRLACGDDREPEESICYYAVRKGWKIGIYKSWKGCWQAIDGYSGSEAKGFATEPEAIQYMYADNVCGKNLEDNEEKEYMESCYMDIHLDDDEGDIPFE